MKKIKYLLVTLLLVVGILVLTDNPNKMYHHIKPGIIVSPTVYPALFSEIEPFKHEIINPVTVNGEEFEDAFVGMPKYVLVIQNNGIVNRARWIKQVSLGEDVIIDDVPYIFIKSPQSLITVDKNA